MDLLDRKLKNKHTHFWYQAKLGAIRNLLASVYLNSEKNKNILEIGCGTGTFLPIINEWGTATGLDKNPEATSLAREQGNKIITGDILNTIIKNKYDSVCCFDVLEHIPDDKKTIKKINTILKPNGYLFITVPAYKFLYGPHDKALKHLRRYDKKELKKNIKQAGFKIIRAGYWNSMLFPLEMAYRLIKKLLDRIFELPERSENKTPPAPINNLLLAIMKIDNFLIKKNRSLPFGL
ncbi:class I SAM-dependent methyltransferase, partial [bacterium]|nr:class I SAM-dependent methyltransferase [bacterium]